MLKNKAILEIAAKTDIGKIREGNEDNFVVTQNCFDTDWILPKAAYENSEAGTVLVVADGMGGLNAGEVASKITVDSIKTYFLGLGTGIIDDKQIKPVLTNAIINAHKQIVANGKSNPETEGMGSTIIIAWIVGTTVHIGWVGDSRCYVYRNGSLVQLSKDHSYVQTLVDKGEINMEQAFFHPEGNIINQSLGDADRTPKPDYVAFSLNNDDVLLLCSDGLNGMLQDNKIESALTKKDNLITTAEVLIDEANNEGGNDNITVILAKVVGGVSEEDASTIGTLEINGNNGKKKINKWLIYPILLLLLAIGYFAYTKYQKPVAITTVDKTTDTDKDGVPDYKDSCKNTAGGAKVDQMGCPITTQIPTAKPVQDPKEKNESPKQKPIDNKPRILPKNDTTHTKKAKEVNEMPPHNSTPKTDERHLTPINPPASKQQQDSLLKSI